MLKNLEPTLTIDLPPVDFAFQSVYRSDDLPEAIASLGGKAGTIAQLSQRKFSIPDWIVILPSAFYQSLTASNRDILASPQIRLDHLRQTVAQVQITPRIQADIEQALQRLCPNGERVAVRSSGLAEDGTAQSFAGQYESFLYVAPHEVCDRIIQVWLSGLSDRLLAYQAESETQFVFSLPTILVQRMVDADCAGVAFSAHPMTGQWGVALVSAVYGLGTSLVSGESDADTYAIDRQGRIVQRDLAAQVVAHRFDPDAGTLVAVSLPNCPTKRSVLNDDQIQAIATLARQVEQALGTPQDIEWAIAQDHLYLLQSRPITTLALIPDPDGGLNLWDNSNIAESYNGVTTPLTFSFARRAYEEVYRQFCRLMGVSEAAIALNSSTFRRMLGLIRGRIYYNLLNWYRVLALLPGFRVNRQFMEQMMGVKEALPEEIVIELAQSTWRDRLRDGWHLGRTLIGLVSNYVYLPHHIRAFYHRLDSALQDPAIPLSQMRPDELVGYYLDLEQQLLTRWDAPLVNDFFAMIFYGVLRKLCVTWCQDELGTLQNDLISGEGGIISAEPAQRVRHLAQLAAQSPDLMQLLCDGSLSRILAILPHYPEFSAEYHTYLAKFGDRCLEELKLESPTLHDDPLVLLRSIGQFARRQDESWRSSLQVDDIPQGTLRDQAEVQVNQYLRYHPIRSVIFGWVLDNARLRVRDRENLRFERTRLFGRVRRIVVEIGKRLAALGILANPRDVFYLELNEILGYIDGTTTCTDLQGLVSLRRQEFDCYRHQSVPGDRFSTRGIVHQGNDFQSSSTSTSDNVTPIPESTLKGMGCCPGIVHAPVQVITDPKNAVLQTGHILVAERTDPGWILLFPAAVGVLVERGSVLSHSAIVARELGIPAIVSLSGLTQWLQTGDWVEMNGSTGIVSRIIPDSISNSKI